jgi:hypothetical protein
LSSARQGQSSWWRVIAGGADAQLIILVSHHTTRPKTAASFALQLGSKAEGVLRAPNEVGFPGFYSGLLWQLRAATSQKAAHTYILFGS